MTIVFTFKPYQSLAQELVNQTGFVLGDMIFRRFPEGESYIKINNDVKNQEVILICGLENADEKIMAIMFFAQSAKELGATKVTLIAPYLGYMRMDKRFNDGEAITSNIFAKFLSTQIDALITVDPHLHRHKTLEEIYTIPCKTLHAHNEIAAWIKNNVENPLLIGPDSESLQWVENIAKKAQAPFLVLQKIRHGDRDVEVLLPQIKDYPQHIPIIVDDIISTANTMIETVKHLQKLQAPAPLCIGIHAIFVGDAFKELQQAGARKIITCNSIAHESNAINLNQLIINSVNDSN